MSRKPLGAIVLHRGKRASLQSQFAEGLKQLIRNNSIEPGDALPSSRELAADFQISRNTVIAACDQLIGEGYLDARPRSGLFIAESLAGNTIPLKQRSAPKATVRPPARITGPVPFRPCQPDVRLFPLTLWNRLRSRALKTHGSGLLHYQSQHPSGLPVLQRALATYLQDSRGVRCSWEQIAVTNGSQQALYQLGCLLLKRGRESFLEDPGYTGARAAFTAAGSAPTPVLVDGEGIIPPARFAPSSLVYTTPSRQFPTGASMPVARRIALLKAAHVSNAWIIEDDYDSEFRYTRPPMPSLHSLDPAGRVIYIGSMSKVLFPSLRIGYIVLPPSLVEEFAELRSISDDHGPLIDQATLAEFISTGALYSHIRRCRKEYAVRLDAFLESARLHLPALQFPHTDGGMNLLGVAGRMDDKAVSGRLNAVGIEVPALREYSISSKRTGLFFGFAAFTPDTIRTSIRRVAEYF